MKYLIVKVLKPTDNSEPGLEHAIVFPDALMHRSVARAHHVGQVIVVSAGFCSFKNGIVSTWGRSESIRMDSRPEDADIVAKVLG